MEGEQLKKILLGFRGEPVFIARGFSIGVFVGMTPFFGIHSWLSLLASTLFRANPLAALVGIQITNIFTAPVIYSLSFKIGSLFYHSDTRFSLPVEYTINTLVQWLSNLSDALIILSIGGLILGIPIAFICHFLMYFLIKSLKKGARDSGQCC